MELPTRTIKLDDGDFLTLDLPTPQPAEKSSFGKLVEESKFTWGAAGDSDVFEKLDFHDDDIYDVTTDCFRYGRMTTGTSYNLVTGKMSEDVFQAVKAKDEEIDEIEEIEVLKETKCLVSTFLKLYDNQMPKYFEYRSTFPKVNGIWTMLFDQDHYQEMSTFELQAAICAALNSRHHLIMCVGVDDYNSVTGVEMSAVDRVVFRMALTRAVVGEFQPPLVKLAPKQLTGITPMKKDVSELLPSIDVLFLPVIGGPKTDGDDGLTSRFLIVVRVKEISEKLYQLSSGRIYAEQEGRVVEMPSLDEAFNKLVLEKLNEDPQKGSFFMLDQDPLSGDSPIPLEACEGEEMTMVVEKCETVSLPITPHSIDRSFSSYKDLENIGWALFATAAAFGFYKTIKYLCR